MAKQYSAKDGLHCTPQAINTSAKVKAILPAEPLQRYFFIPLMTPNSENTKKCHIKLSSESIDMALKLF